MTNSSSFSSYAFNSTTMTAVASFLPRQPNDSTLFEKTKYTFSLVHPVCRKQLMESPRGFTIGPLNVKRDFDERCHVAVCPFSGVQPKICITDCFHITVEGVNGTYYDLLSTVLFLKQKSGGTRCITELKVGFDDDVNHDDDLLQDLLEELKDDLESFEGIYVHVGVFEAVRLPKLKTLILSEPKGWLSQSLATIIPNLITCELFTSHTRRVQTADFLEHFCGETLYLDGVQLNFTGREIKDPSRLEKLSVIDCRAIESIELENYTSLRTLLLSRTAIDTLEGVSGCANLRLLNASGSLLLKDVNCLSALQCLRELFLHETKVTNAGILGLSGCRNLEKLNLGGCANLSNVNCLGTLAFLKELHLWSTKITDDGIQELKGCHSLVELVLDDCAKIKDVSCLKGLLFLRYLSLIGTSVDAKGIKELRSCPLLECLAISGTQVENPPKLWSHDSIVEYLTLLLP